MAQVINSMDFEKEVIKSPIPVLVDFYATWCMPCKMMAPSLDEISKELKGKAKIVKMDIEDSEEVVNKYNIKGVPTLLFFKNGEVCDFVSGALGKSEIYSKMNAIV